MLLANQSKKEVCRATNTIRDSAFNYLLRLQSKVELRRNQLTAQQEALVNFYDYFCAVVVCDRLKWRVSAFPAGTIGTISTLSLSPSGVTENFRLVTSDPLVSI